MKNPYFKKAHISQQDMENLLRAYVNDKNAKEICDVCSITYRPAKIIYQKIRQSISEYGDLYESINRENIPHTTNMHTDRIYGIIQKENKIIIIPVAEDKQENSILLPAFDQFYQGVLVNNKVHLRVHTRTNQEKNISSKLIDNFWSYTQSRLKKFYGISKETYYLHLRECQFRFNLRGQDIYEVLCQMLKRYPL